MDIKATDVKKLREKTGAGMMDCKKALAEAEGDFEKAEKILKELGLAAAAKRGGKATNEGRVFTYVGDGQAAIVELSCETDFVARNSEFVELGDSIAADMAAKSISFDDPEFAERVKNAAATIKENMSIARGEVLTADGSEIFSAYVHGESGSIGTVVRVKADPMVAAEEAVKAFAFDVALHVAAFKPAFLSSETVDSGYVAEQKEIFLAQAKQLDKPENVTQGIAQGKLKKHLSEICLLQQGFVKDEKKSVAQAAKDLSKEVGGEVSVSGYVYYVVGQGS